MSELNDDHLDRALREKFGSFGQHPSERVWNNISKQLPKPAPRFPRALPFILCALLGALIGTQVPDLNVTTPADSETLARAASPAAAGSVSEQTTLPATPQLAEVEKATAVTTPSTNPVPANTYARNNVTEPARYSGIQVTPVRQHTITPAALPVLVVTDSIKSEPVQQQHAEVRPVLPVAPVAMAVQIPVGVKPVVELETQLLPLLSDTTRSENSRADLSRKLRAQRASLSALVKRNDSLLLAMESSFVKETIEQPALDSSVLKPAVSKWSIALSMTPEQNFLSLTAPRTDTLVSMRNNRETGRSGYNAAFQVERKLNDRLSIGAGFGYSSYGSEFRMTTRETELTVTYDTTHTFDTVVYTSVTTTPIVRVDSVMTLEANLNGNGQIVDYDTIYVVLTDTVYSTFTTEDIIASQHTTINPNTSRHEVTREQIMRPRYHFVTLPVMLRYRLTPGARWWADVGFGGQLQLFRGGTHAVSADGRNFRMERVKPNEGPFRPVNLALMGNLAMNYGLTKRLSISMAPAIRWQVQSVYKKETGLQQRPVSAGLQFGLRYNL